MEWATTNNGKYKIVSLSAATVPGALDMIRDSFCQDEAVCIATKVNENLLAAEELLELCADAALDGVSLVAVETSSGEVVGTAFNKVQVASSDSSERPFFEVFAEERCTQPSARELVRFMATVDGKCNLFQKYGVDCSFEIMFLGTSANHRRQGLAGLLCKTSIEIARKLKNGPVSQLSLQDLGPKYAHMKPRSVTTEYPKICQAIWTAEGTMKIGKKLNFVVHLTDSLDEYTYEGKSYAERIGKKDSFCEVAALLL